MSFSKFLLAAQLALNAVIDFSAVTALLTRLLLDLPYSRALELEADAIGLQLMAAACFDPAASPAMFARLGAGDAPTAAKRLLSTHPVFADRIARLEAQLPGAQGTRRTRCPHIADPPWAAAAGAWPRRDRDRTP
jgi:metalloendopeptidase OMA1, mitochondrial